MEKKKNKKPKYLTLYETICKKIADGEYMADSYLPPERKICEIYNVGRMTVRNTMDILAKEGKIKKIQGAGNLVVQHAVANQNPKTVAFVISGDYGEKFRQPFIESLFLNMEQEFRKAGYKLICIVLKKEDAVLDILIDKTACVGVVFVSYIADKFLEAVKKADMPVILISGTHDEMVSINSNNIDGCFEATEYLVKTGSSKIAFISGIRMQHNSIQRQTGYKRALLCNGIMYDESIIRAGDWDYESGYTSMHSLLLQHPDIDGVVAANDMMAFGAIKAILQSGRRVPLDVQVIGFDNIEQCKFNTPALSTIGVDPKFLSMLTVSLLQNQSQGHKTNGNILVPASLFLRETTRELSINSEEKHEKP